MDTDNPIRVSNFIELWQDYLSLQTKTTELQEENSRLQQILTEGVRREEQHFESEQVLKQHVGVLEEKLEQNQQLRQQLSRTLITLREDYQDDTKTYQIHLNDMFRKYRRRITQCAWIYMFIGAIIGASAVLVLGLTQAKLSMIQDRPPVQNFEAK